METKKILGIIIIMVLLAAIITAIYITAFGNVQQENDRTQIKNSYKLTNAEMQGINYVNINLISNTSSVDISFQNNSDSIYDITVNRDNNSKEPSVTYNKQGNILNVNILLDSGSTRLVLGNKHTYNGTFDTKVGGFSASLTNDSKIDNFSTNIKYIGGGMLNIVDTSFNKLNMNVNLGGFTIQGENSNIKKSGIISTNVQIGGVNAIIRPKNDVGIKIRATTDLGGFSFEPSGFEVIKNDTTTLDIQTVGYNNQNIKLQVDNVIGLGGMNINMFSIPLPTQAS
jgi:hypothetical protein